MKRIAAGYLTLVMVGVLLIISVVAMLVVQIYTTTTLSSLHYMQSVQALGIAEAGLEQGTYQLRNFANRDYSARRNCSGVAVSNIKFGEGTYDLTSTLNNSSTPLVLSEAISTASDTIPVAMNGAQKYSIDGGRILIDREYISYNQFDGSSFKGITRGVDGSIIRAHAAGTPIGQNQCQVRAIAYVPNPQQMNARTQVTQKVQLDAAWLIATPEPDKKNLVFGVWNGQSWLSQEYSSNASSNQLNSINMLSFADGWAVGGSGNKNTNAEKEENPGSATKGRGLVSHWNGSEWIFQSLPSKYLVSNLNSIYCVSSQDCWAVGYSTSLSPITLHWNGAAWLLGAMSAATQKAPLNAVHCPTANLCFAVGAPEKTKLNININTGSGWLPQAAQEDPGCDHNKNSLRSVYCATANNCWAVGDGNNLGKKTCRGPLLLNYNGSKWALSTQVDSRIPEAAQFNSVFCNHHSDCWAVGANDLIAHWDGNRWSRSSFSVLDKPTSLNSVHCNSSSNCWIAGDNNILLHWDGNLWSRINSTLLPAGNYRGIYFITPNNGFFSHWHQIFS